MQSVLRSRSNSELRIDEQRRIDAEFALTATKAQWADIKDSALYKSILKRSTLRDIPAALRLAISDDIQAESPRPIQIIRGGTHLNINYGTIIKIPTNRPPASIGYTNDVFKMMDLMGLVKPANAGWMCAQEQIDWIKIAGKSGFKKP